MGKDKKKKHKKKHRDEEQEMASTTGWVYEFTYTVPLTSFGTAATGSGTIWSVYVPRVQVPQMFQDAFEDGELDV